MCTPLIQTTSFLGKLVVLALPILFILTAVLNIILAPLKICSYHYLEYTDILNIFLIFSVILLGILTSISIANLGILSVSFSDSWYPNNNWQFYHPH